jgi:Fur family ferric uptake transcriptional regulator
MQEPLNELRNTLKSHRQSLTGPRQLVFKALEDKEPQTMHQLVAACSGHIDRASIYRTIALFEKLGIVQRLQIGWKYKLELSDRFSHHHHHLTCTGCGATIALPEDRLLEDRLRSLASALHFKAGDHQIEVRGLCQNCQTATHKNDPARKSAGSVGSLTLPSN